MYRNYSLPLLAMLLALIFVSPGLAQLYTIQYDDGNPYYYSGRPDPYDTCGVWFEPPSECRLISAKFQFYSAGDVHIYVWDLVDDFDPDDYYDTDEVAGVPGPSPLDRVLLGPIPYTFQGLGTGVWEEIVFSQYGGPPQGINVGNQYFFVGYVLLGGGPNLYDPSIYGDVADERPYHSLAWLNTPGGMHPNEPGWWAYGIDWMLRATVNIYGDPPPVISGIDDPPDTYLPGPYNVEATITDLGPGGQPGQVVAAQLVYTAGTGMPDTAAMTNIGGNLWQGNLPPMPVNELITFHVEAQDNGGLTGLSSNFYFTYRQPSGASILLVKDGAEAQSEEVYFETLVNGGYDYDFWDIEPTLPTQDMGYPGSDVINTTNYTSVIWYTGTANPGSLPENDANLNLDPVANFMDAGGNFCLSSSDYLGGAFGGGGIWTFFTAPTNTFMYNYLKVLDGWSDSHPNASGESQDTAYIGIAGDPVSAPFAATYFQNHPDPNYNDFANPLPGAFTCFRTQIDDESAGIRYSGTYKMVFLPWVLEACDNTFAAQGILQNVLEYFGAGGPVVDVDLIPKTSLVTIPPGGGNFGYLLSITNHGTTPQEVQGWVMVRLPNGTPYGPVLGPLDLNLPASVTLTRLRSQNVPGSAPPGTYTYTAYVGQYASVILDSAYFNFSKTGMGADGPICNWNNTGETFAIETIPDLPSQFALSAPSPNPFNPSTAISYELRASSHVCLQVYDTAGRMVATLVDSWREAGEHSLTWDASNLPSGMYLICLEAGEQMEVRKAVLLK